MKKRNFKVGLVVFFLAGTVFFLAGCGKKEELNNAQENKSVDQNQQQSQKVQSSNETNRIGNPPEEMTSVCNGKSEGDICEVTMPSRGGESESRNITGKCAKMQDNEALICRSENMPGGPGRGTLQGQASVNTTE